MLQTLLRVFGTKRNTYKSEYGVYLLSKAKEIVYRKAYPKGLYILGFINALFYRECCYQCHYATPNRISDFTLGDYHDNEGQYNSLPGCRRILSMAMINTIKAEGIWRKINCHVEYSLCPMETIIEKHDSCTSQWSNTRTILLLENYICNMDLKIA